MKKNQRVLVAQRPRFIVPTTGCFKLESAPVPEPADGQLLLQTLWLSMDVMLYAKVQHVTSQAEPVVLGDVMVGPAVGRVVSSKHPDHAEGELLSGFWGWENYSISSGRRLRRLDDFCAKKSSYALSAYGAPAFGAYVAVKVLTAPREGETVVVGTATGGLGSIAGQMAKLRGCRVVGIAGSDEKCRFAVEKTGFDACVDRTARDFDDRLREACPDGVDVLIDTIGDRALAAVLPVFNAKGRIASCGLMATPHFDEKPYSGKYSSTMNVLYEIINRRLQIHGLVVWDHLRAELDNFHRDMSEWVNTKQVLVLEDIVEGLAAAPRAFQDVFEGKNFGKRLVKVAD